MEHLEEMVASLRAVPDPEDRIRAIDAARKSWLATQRVLAELRRESIREMLATMSKSEIARRLKISPARVSTLVGPDAHQPARYARGQLVEERQRVSPHD